MREAKKLGRDEITGFTSNLVTKYEGGHVEPGLAALKKLAVALDATTDYFLGLGDDYAGSFELAAAKMSFSYFERGSDR